MHQAFRFELDPSNVTSGALASHTGASRFAYNWGLALVKARLSQREKIRLAGFRELLPDDEVERLACTVEVPWTLSLLRKAWNLKKADEAPWWSENSKEAYSSGLDGLARALDGFLRRAVGSARAPWTSRAARNAGRGGPVGSPREVSLEVWCSVVVDIIRLGLRGG